MSTLIPLQVVPGPQGILNILDKPLPSNTYFHDPAWTPNIGAPPKAQAAGVGERVIEGVLMHFTAGGSAIGAWSTFSGSVQTLGYPESVPYIVDLDGTVWRCYDEAIGWSYHIGVGAGPYAKNHMHDRRLVGIEIVCPGPLWLGHDGDSLTWNGGKIVHAKLSAPDPLHPVLKLPTPYRGVQYYVPMTPAQMLATALLVTHLQQRWQFPEKLAPLSSPSPDSAIKGADLRFAANMEFYAGASPFKGVQSHVNYRIDKWDQSPGHSDALWAHLEDLGFTE